MSLVFPDWSDLGGVSLAQRNTWEHEAVRRDRYRYYYEGEVFRETVPGESASEDDEDPLLYPIGLNLVKMLCVSQADSLFGEWEEDIIRFRARQDVAETPAGEAAIELCSTILSANNAAVSFYEGALQREIYGGCFYKIGPDLGRPGHIRISLGDLDNFYPIWNPEDPDDLLEAYIRVVMTREQAKALYAYTPQHDRPTVERIEKWTRDVYENHLDGMRIEAYSGLNPWRVVPIVYIPRLRAGSWWGDALTPDIIPVQDEINMRVADMGEAINYNSHPVRWGKNLAGDFNQKVFPLGPRAMWNLGRTIGNGPEPEVGMLQSASPIPERALDFIKFVYDYGRTAASSPPIAFGEDQGGGQRSGRTLEIRMWPLMKATRKSRAYFASGVSRMMVIAAKILRQKKIEGISTHALSRIIGGSIVPDFFPLMPKDQAALVDEVNKLLNLDPPGISMQTAQALLGRGPVEVKRIKDMLEDPVLGPLFQNRSRIPASEDQETEKETADGGAA